MKLSNVLLTTLVLTAASASAQEKENTQVKKVRKVSSVERNNIRKLEAEPLRMEIMTDTIKKDTTKVDSTIHTFPISPDYCPPCGMG